MLLMVEEEQALETEPEICRVQGPGLPEIVDVIEEGPEEKGDQQPGQVAGVEPFERQLLIRSEHQRAGHHQKQRHAGPGSGAEKHAAVPIRASHFAAKTGGKGVDGQHGKNGDQPIKFHSIIRLRLFLCSRPAFNQRNPYYPHCKTGFHSSVLHNQ